MNQILSANIAPGTPLYKVVKRRLTESMRDGEWKPGDVIPSEKALSERFQVSIGTVRKAVDELTAENLLIRHQGRGTYVASHDRERQFFYFFHITRQDGYKEYPKVELVSFSRARADATTAKRLGIAEGDKVFRFMNRQSISERPVIIDDIIVPADMFPGLTEKRLRERPNTLYRFYQEEFAVSVVRTEERLRAVKADDEQARVLNVKKGDPLLQVLRLALSFRDQPVEFRSSYVDTRDYEYFAERTSAG